MQNSQKQHTMQVLSGANILLQRAAFLSTSDLTARMSTLLYSNKRPAAAPSVCFLPVALFKQHLFHALPFSTHGFTPFSEALNTPFR